jgi:hypothetical protein
VDSNANLKAHRDIDKELYAVGDNPSADTVEVRIIKSVGTALFLEHASRDSANEDGFRNSTRAVTSKESIHFCTAGRVPDEYGVFEVEVLEKGKEIVCPGVDVVSFLRLARASVASEVVGNNAVAVVCEEVHF